MVALKTVRSKFRSLLRGVTTQTFLTQVGLVVGPATIVALLCQLIDLTARDTAAICLGVTLFIALIQYHVWIEAHLSSAWTLAALAAAMFLYYFTYENILLKDTGLSRYYKASNDFLGEDLGERIEGSADEIWFFGASFHISADDQNRRLLAALNRGVDVHYLILDPSSDRMDAIARDFDSTEENLRTDCEATMSDLNDIFREWNQVKKSARNPGRLQVRLFRSTPRFRGYFFDPGESGQAYLVPYINRIASPDSPAFLFENCSSGVAQHFYAGMKRLWEDSLDYQLKSTN